MQTRLIEPTPSAYGYPLLIKNLLDPPLRYAPNQEIVYRDKVRMNYRQLAERIHRLANALADLGVKPGQTVAVMDWDSHRYLECFFAVPMMGAVLHTINIRLSPEQLIYTINHAQDDVILVNSEFLPMLAAVRDQMTTVKKIILLNDEPQAPETPVPLDGEYEALLAAAKTSYDFPDFDENTMATTFYTTGTTGMLKGVFFSHRQLVLHTYGILTGLSCYRCQSSLDTGDVYMPITPMFHVHAWGVPYVCTMLGLKQVYPGRYEPAMLLKLLVTEKVTFSHCRAHHPAYARFQPGHQDRGSLRLEGGHRRRGHAQGAVPGGPGPQHQRLFGLRHVRDLPGAHRGQPQTAHARLGHGPQGGDPLPHRLPGAQRTAGNRGRQRSSPAPRRPGGGRSGGARALADPGLRERPRAQRGVVEKRLVAHR
jgi:non-ribosomal peptide synthetase component E (peptide arylation enzyme)